MSKRLTIEDLKKKITFHQKKVDFYDRKLEELEQEKKQIGFKYKKPRT